MKKILLAKFECPHLNSVKMNIVIILLSLLYFWLRKNELQNLCLCNSRDGCQLSSIKSTGRNLSFAKFCFILPVSFPTPPLFSEPCERKVTLFHFIPKHISAFLLRTRTFSCITKNTSVMTKNLTWIQACYIVYNTVILNYISRVHFQTTLGI